MKKRTSSFGTVSVLIGRFLSDWDFIPIEQLLLPNGQRIRSDLSQMDRNWH